MKAFSLAAGVALAYLLATAAWSPIDRWWNVNDSVVYYRAAASIASGTYNASPAVDDNRFRYCRPPLYPTILYVTGTVTDEDIPWFALLWNVLCVGMVGWGTAQWLRGQRIWAVAIASIICLPHVPMIHSDMTAVGFGCTALGLLKTRSLDQTRSIFVGLFLGTAILVRQSALGFALITVLYLMLHIRVLRYTRCCAILVVATIVPICWAGYVYTQTGIFTIASHNLTNNVYLRTIPALMTQ